MNSLRRLLLAALAVSVAACGATRVAGGPLAGERSSERARSADIALPIKGNLIVYVAPKDLARQTKIPATSGNPEYWLEEGKLLQQAALSTFATLFERVSPGKKPSAPFPFATVEGSSSFNPMLGAYSARVIVTFASNNAPIAKLEAKSLADGYDEAAFVKALDAAFQDIRSQFLANQALATAARQLAPAQAVMATAGSGTASMPPATGQQGAQATAAAEAPRAVAPTAPIAAAAEAPRAVAATAPIAAAAEAPRAVAPAAPINQSVQPVPSAAVKLPIKSTLTVYMAPNDLARQTKIPSSSGNQEYWLDEGKLLQQAALKAFASLFEHVSPGKKPSAPFPFATVEGSSSFNPIFGAYSARVIVTFASNNAPIAKLEAKSIADGYDEVAFVKALDAAFQDICKQFVDSTVLAAAVSQLPVTPVAAAAATNGAVQAPPAPFTAAQLPIKGELWISMPPEMMGRQSFVNQGYSSYWFNEGSVIESAAIRAFGRLFVRVSTLEEGDARYPMAKVEGSSDYNPIMGTYYAKVVADFFPGAGDPIATLTARASADGAEEVGFEKAYDAAFRDLSRQFLEDGALGTALAAAASQASSEAAAQAGATGSSKPPVPILIPNKGNLVVYMAPEDLSKQTVVAAGLGYASYWVAEGKIVEAAAIRTFGKVFERVSPGAPGGGAHPVLVVRGNGSFNPIMKTYSASVNATFLSPDGVRIGKFEARADADEEGSGEIGFRKAYEAAFQRIVDRLVAAGHV